MLRVQVVICDGDGVWVIKLRAGEQGSGHVNSNWARDVSAQRKTVRLRNKLIPFVCAGTSYSFASRVLKRSMISYVATDKKLGFFDDIHVIWLSFHPEIDSLRTHDQVIALARSLSYSILKRTSYMLWWCLLLMEVKMITLKNVSFYPPLSHNRNRSYSFLYYDTAALQGWNPSPVNLAWSVGKHWVDVGLIVKIRAVNYCEWSCTSSEFQSSLWPGTLHLILGTMQCTAKKNLFFGVWTERDSLHHRTWLRLPQVIGWVMPASSP